MKLRSILAVAPCFGLVAVVACSGGDGSDFPNGVNGGNPPDGGNPGFNLGGGEGGAGGGGDLSQCATATAQPNPVPVDLVFMFDKSGSMDDNSKWTSCAAGLTSFFGDAKSTGMSASLQFFPQSNECSTNVYAAPQVSLRALPDATTFSAAISANSPGGGTPTVPALSGAVQYAQSIASSKPGDKVAIVLVTDGEPNDCNSDVQGVANVAASVSSTIPTFVIGVGNTGNLDAIAQAGGTNKATIVSTNSPQQTEQDFQTALNAIRGITLACEYQLPPPPQGQTFDENKVNVVYKPTNGGPLTLTYNQDCTGGTGWHYDDPKNPTKIELCGTTCNSVQAASGSISIVMGCATNGAIPH